MVAYASVCSGIEAPSVAWEPLGWEPVFFSEIDKFPRAVLKHHYPHVANHGDMNRFKESRPPSDDKTPGTFSQTSQPHTAIPYRGKPAADGPRYKALGNSMAVNVVRWLGQRIQMVEDVCAAPLFAEAAE